MNVAVVGAGETGTDVARACATAGHSVTVRDLEPNVVMDAIDTVSTRVETDATLSDADRSTVLDALEGTTDLQSAVSDADVVLEAVPDELERKRELLGEIEGFVDEGTVLATTTASLSVSVVADPLEHPNRVVGLNFADSAADDGLVEVVRGSETDDETAGFASAFVDDLGTDSVAVDDTPGRASDRLGLSLAVEAMRLVEEGVTTVGDADAAMTVGYGHPVGPLELSDRVGLDARLATLERLHEELGDRFEPPELLREKVEAGEVGKPVGRGFYVWEGGDPVRPADEAEDVEDPV